MSEEEATDQVDSGLEELSFKEAIERLEEILARVEDESIDIDLLAAELTVASQLLEVCRGKIHRAEVEVQRVVASFDDESLDTSGT